MTTQITSFNCLSQDLLLGKHIIGTSVFKVLLTDTLPVVANAVKADITEITPANGYSAGGPTTTISKTLTGTTTKLVATDVTVTATGAVGPFRYAVIYNATFSGNPLVGFVDYGSEITMANTDTFTVHFDATNGIISVG